MGKRISSKGFFEGRMFEKTHPPLKSRVAGKKVISQGYREIFLVGGLNFHADFVTGA